MLSLVNADRSMSLRCVWVCACLEVIAAGCASGTLTFCSTSARSRSCRPASFGRTKNKCQDCCSAERIGFKGETLERVMDPKADERFTRIYETHYLAVLAYCARRVNRSDVEDVSSEVFTVLWRKMDAFDPAAPLPWLYKVALGRIRNRHRATRRSIALIRKIGGTQSTTGSSAPDVVIVRNEQDEEALRTLARLREPDQEVIRLAIWEELSAKEIGLVLRCSTSAAEQRLHRAKKRLARKFSPSPFYRSDASPEPLEEGGRP